MSVSSDQDLGAPRPESPSEAQGPESELHVLERIARLEQEFLHESFADFERSVLQDNIALCDTKSGVLLAFAGAMTLFSLDSFTKATGAHWLGPLGAYLAPGAFLISAAALLASASFSLSTVRPRLRRTNTEDHIFWESSAFKAPPEEYLRQMRSLTVEVEYDEKLLHLHTLAGVCRAKFAHFRRAMDFAVAGFVVLMIAELIRG